MPKLSQKSLDILNTCHDDLVIVVKTVIRIVDIKVLCGVRGEAEQNYLYRMGFSQKVFPNSRHNAVSPKKSEAVDIAPYPIDWKDIDRFYYVGGIMLGVSAVMGIRIRWGGDWDMDTELHDQSFMDLGHFELVGDGL